MLIDWYHAVSIGGTQSLKTGVFIQDAHVEASGTLEAPSLYNNLDRFRHSFIQTIISLRLLSHLLIPQLLSSQKGQFIRNTT
ncbi:hypothetical protein BCY86_03085 [Pajaroellobacter abortibovis]|uniref:Uncharacterized protein n=1 Tax=Pajaroellobacter abortibovis TaxID=1882918 RepID=A0A1L6MW46_9BACT|nr:hypothetical protein BCY86_03085 [Pajaroellobacter abortibovis]